MSSMIRIARFLAKHPSDPTIRIYRVVLGCLIGLVLFMDFSGFQVRWGGSIEVFLRYALFIFAIVPIVFGALGICFARRKHIRYAEATFGLLLIVIGQGFLVANEPIILPSSVVPIVQSSGSTVDYSSAVTTPVSTDTPTPSRVHIGAWLTLIALLPLLSAATGKMITEGCLKYGEKITKIRV